MNETRFNSDKPTVIIEKRERVFKKLTKSEINKRRTKRRRIEKQIDKLDSKRDEYNNKIKVISDQLDGLLDIMYILNKEIYEGIEVVRGEK